MGTTEKLVLRGRPEATAGSDLGVARNRAQTSSSCVHHDAQEQAAAVRAVPATKD